MRLFITISCVLAALLGALVLHFQLESLRTVLEYMTLVWLLSYILLNGWVGRDWRAAWKQLDVTIPQIYRQAKAGTLPKKDVLDTVVGFGMVVLTVVSTYLSIFG